MRDLVQESQPPGQETPGFFARIGLAFAAFFRILGSGQEARAYLGRGQPEGPAEAPPKGEEKAAPAAAPLPSAPPPKILREADPDLACQLLAALQREGRFVDFIQEDLSGADDAAIGAAARVVHEGCRKTLNDLFTLGPVHSGDEESQVTVKEASPEVQLTGNVSGSAPYTGTLRHRGWKVTEVRLPRLTKDHDVRVIAPAEVEL